MSCAVCQDEVTSQCISALSYKLHADCFVCTECLMPFAEGKFFENSGRLFCEKDYQALFGSRCARCGETISGRSITALDMKWHPEHFMCDECGKPLAGTSFMKRFGRPLCKECLELIKQREADRNKNMCDRCKKPILDPKDMLIIKKLKYHANHFSCTTCKKPLTADCKELEGKLYCTPCYNMALQSTCAVCRRPIEGRSINALGKMFHPEHFVCTKCERQFAGQNYYEYQGNPYCETHYNELTGAHCARCGQPATGRVVYTGSRQWCDRHFTCIGCDEDLANPMMKGRYFDWDTKLMCHSCYGKLPSKLATKLAKYADVERKFAEAAMRK